MTAAADLVLLDAEVHTLTEPDETHEAVAVRGGEVVRVDRDYEVEFLVDVDTEVVDCEGRVVLPGFVDAHTHLEHLGQYRVHADLGAADSLSDCVDRLAADAERDAGDDHDWVLGFNYDESDWGGEARYPTREDLDAVSTDRPVAAFRVDMHSASLNSVALDRLADELPGGDVETAGGEPTGVVVEDAVGVVRDAVEPDRETTREYLLAARDHAHRHGVTCVHEMVRDSHAPSLYRELDLADELALRVRLNYWSDHLDAAIETGLRTGHGSGLVRTGGIKTFTDGSIGSRTAKLFAPYADLEDPDERADGGRGTWVVEPDELREIVRRADAHGFQVTAHAIGDEAIEETLAAFEATDDPGGMRHRVEHAELSTDEHVERFAASGVVASVQPNFLRWADDGGLYDRRLGEERRRLADRFGAMLDAGVHLAFGSDCMPMDPLLGVHLAVNAPVEEQRLSVTEALRAYTHGAAYAGFDEGRMGTVEVGRVADFAVLDDSPWEHAGAIRDVDVAMTVVDGDVVYDGR